MKQTQLAGVGSSGTDVFAASGSSFASGEASLASASGKKGRQQHVPLKTSHDATHGMLIDFACAAQIVTVYDVDLYF